MLGEGAAPGAETFSAGPEFALHCKRTAPAVQRCKNQQRRWSYGLETVSQVLSPPIVEGAPTTGAEALARTHTRPPPSIGRPRPPPSNELDPRLLVPPSPPSSNTSATSSDAEDDDDAPARADIEAIARRSDARRGVVVVEAGDAGAAGARRRLWVGDFDGAERCLQTATDAVAAALVARDVQEARRALKNANRIFLEICRRPAADPDELEALLEDTDGYHFREENVFDDSAGRGGAAATSWRVRGSRRRRGYELESRTAGVALVPTPEKQRRRPRRYARLAPRCQTGAGLRLAVLLKMGWHDASARALELMLDAKDGSDYVEASRDFPNTRKRARAERLEAAHATAYPRPRRNLPRGISTSRPRASPRPVSADTVSTD